MCQARGTGASVGRRCYQGSSSFQPTFARIGDAGGELGLEFFWGTHLEVFLENSIGVVLDLYWEVFRELNWSFIKDLKWRFLRELYWEVF